MTEKNVKTMRGVMCCARGNKCTRPNGEKCPYIGNKDECVIELMEDVLELMLTTLGKEAQI